jgi:hypothetical protein
MNQTGSLIANFNIWLHEIAKESFGFISTKDLQVYSQELQLIFNKITFQDNNTLLWNDFFDRYSINSKIRLAFSIQRELRTSNEVVPTNANLLLIEKLGDVVKNDKLFPEQTDVQKIIELDKSGQTLDIDINKVQSEYQQALNTLKTLNMENMIVPLDEFLKKYDYSLAVRSKNNTFHYLPYNFVQSSLEKEILQRILQLDTFRENALEVYYNGERALTEFVIDCFASNGTNWKNIGRYTTDFLIIQRNNNSIHKILLVETKGIGFSTDPSFLQKKHFVETEFLKQNNDKFGYQRFDFIYLEESNNMITNITKLSNKINDFFNG